jgi:mercuric ion transport protein
MQAVARKVHLVVAGLLVAGLVTQIFLAGLGVFRDPASFETHRNFGFMLELLPLILLVVGLAARLGRRMALMAAGIFGLFILQSVLVELRTSAPEVAALHPVNGFLITLIAIVLARTAWAGRDAPIAGRRAMV